MSNDNEELDSQNQPTEEVVENPVIEEESTEEETENDVSKLKELNKKLYERAKEAEAKVKELKTVTKPEPQKEVPKSIPSGEGTPPLSDLVALSKLHEDDVSDVVEYAKFKKISIRDALKTNVIKTMLAEKAEERKTADATATGSQKRGSAKVSDEALYDKAEKGDLPDSDEDLRKIVRMRQQKKV